MKQTRQQGVALVITLILLSLLMIMVVTFVALSRRERTATATASEQTTARLAVETAFNHAKVKVLARIRALQNLPGGTNVTLTALGPDFFVSTNYINYAGYNPDVGAVNITNVNFERRVNGSALTSDDFVAVCANLFFDPRAPVAVRTNADPRYPLDFRFYLDLNRNGLFEPNGYWPELDAQGNPITGPGGIPITNFFMGDPEWIGVLEQPLFPHSRTNRFVARFAYAVVPLDRALDLNYIHNQAKQLTAGLLDSDPAFHRNQGVGTWEINLAAFLCDLNPVIWNPPESPYLYAPDPSMGACAGVAFVDALNVVSWRYGGSVLNLPSAVDFLGRQAEWAFTYDLIDGYSDGIRPSPGKNGIGLTENDQPTRTGWPGADHIRYFASMQELFDLPGLGQRLTLAGQTNLATENRYTFYRLMAQLGADSTPESEKVHANYLENGAVRAEAMRNWSALAFFTNAADRIIRRYAEEYDFVGVGMTNMQLGTLTISNGVLYSARALKIDISLTNIPIWPINFYTPGVHRMLQLAANIYDATTNRVDLTTTEPFPPSVFSPVFERTSDGWVRIVGYVERADRALVSSLPVEPHAIHSRTDGYTKVWGIPVVIGAKKGFPAFNEFGMMPVSVVTRKLLIRRPDPTKPPTETNVMYVIGISNTVALEAWNSYTNAYPRGLELGCYIQITSAFTNNHGLKYETNIVIDRTLARAVNIPAGTWQGYTPYNYSSFLVPVLFGYEALPLRIMRATQLLPTVPPVYFQLEEMPVLACGVEFTARVWFYLVDTGLNRVVDCVNLYLPGNHIDIGAVISQGAGTNETAATAECWNPRLIGNSSVSYGIKQQLSICGGTVGSDTDWRDYNSDPVTGTDKQYAINFFKAFLGKTNTTGQTTLQTAFNPVRKFYRLYSWQANDPLVHYTAWDLADLLTTNADYFVKPHANVLSEFRTIGYLNSRYEPWGGRSGTDTSPTAFNLAVKDPLVTCSDDWFFPTSKLATLGWLGMVHRGTPWQTVYLKASDIGTTRDGLRTWVRWTGNPIDPALTLPVTDRILLDLFTVRLNDNATRGQLSINQSGLAAWSAVLSGITVWSNSTPDAVVSARGRAATLQFIPLVIEPAANSGGPFSPLARIVNAINSTRTNFPAMRFRRLGDVLATPELTEKSPFLNLSSAQQRWGIPEMIYEWIPMQVLSLLRCDDRRFVVYAYGQALKPADNGIVPAGPFMGLCTNYQVTAEAAAKAVFRIEGTPQNPRIVQESFNLLGPDR